MKQGCRFGSRGWSGQILGLTGAGLAAAVTVQVTAAPEQPPSLSASVLPAASIAVKQMPSLDMEAIAIEDAQRQSQDVPLRFAIPNATQIKPDSEGTWEKIDANTLIWRLRITCPNAVSINLGFTRFTLPEGAALFLYDTKDVSNTMRPFTSADNQPYNQLWTPVVLSNDVTVELSIPEAQRRNLDLELGSINLGYWDFTKADQGGDDGGIANTGSCNVDTICSQADAWRTEIQAVARITIQGSALCTGWMTNNTANDKKNYFMTAFHCGLSAGNAPTLICYWNYFNSTCRPIGGASTMPPGNGSLSQFTTGSTWRAGYSPTDFTLVELSSTPSSTWQVTYAGWDRIGNSSPSGTGIHHPGGYEKRISFYSSSAFPSSYGGNSSPGDGTHVRVVWNLGVTEGGSSGSPIFDNNKRVIGQLHGGSSFCSQPFSPDWYGRLAVSWTGGGTSTSRLSNWLDPLNTGQLTLDSISGLAPAHDSCAGALNVQTGNTAVNTATATSDGFGEPSCGFGGNSLIDKDLWFKWLPTCTGTATVSFCDASFNARMAVYIGCPAGPGSVIACNDNFCGIAPQVSFPVIQNQLHRIRIGGFNNSSGTGTLNITCVPNPPACPADANNSGSVNIDDLVMIITNWGTAHPQADVNDSGLVDIDDLVMVITEWGPC